MPELPKHSTPTHRVTGYIAFDVPADDCAMVQIAMEAAVKDLGGEITNYDYARDDYDPHDYGHSDHPRRIPECQCSACQQATT